MEALAAFSASSAAGNQKPMESSAVDAAEGDRPRDADSEPPTAEGSDWGSASEPDDAAALDDSGDGDCNAGSAPSAGSENEADGETRPSEVAWRSEEMQGRVSSLIMADDCEARCLVGKEVELQKFLMSIYLMSKLQIKTSVFTALAILKETDVADRRRGHGERKRYAYFLPHVGRVCREAFGHCYGVSITSIKRFRAQIKSGSFAPLAHAGARNNNASVIDITWLVSWFKSLAKATGEVVPVRIRKQTTINGEVQLHYSPVDYVLLPAALTWDQLHEQMHRYVVSSGLSVREPAKATMRQLLTKHCPMIRIRSPRSNVCDVCSIYQSRMRGPVTADVTEDFGKHTLAARRMRQEYKNDIEQANDDCAVLIIDFSQNLTLPSVSCTPSQWYFLSLWSVNMFGIFFANRGIQYNYLYEERTAGKGSDEVISMIDHFVETVLRGEYARLVVYADNCSGQNKNNYVLKYLLALSHKGAFEEVAFKFFVKGHTKSAVDRGFGHVRKRFAREDVYTMEQLVAVVNSAATSSATVVISADMPTFKSFKTVLTDMYSDVSSIRKYQVFIMKESKPGIVACSEGPDDEPVESDLRRRYDGIYTDADKVEVMFQMHLGKLHPPKINAEKVLTMFTKVRPFVPPEFHGDSLYAAPTDEQEDAAKTAKKSRTGKRKAAKNATCESKTASDGDGGGQREVMVVDSSSAGAQKVGPSTVGKRRSAGAGKKSAPAKKMARKDQ